MPEDTQLANLNFDLWAIDPDRLATMAPLAPELNTSNSQSTAWLEWLWLGPAFLTFHLLSNPAVISLESFCMAEIAFPEHI
jgi:hypothetical protein